MVVGSGEVRPIVDCLLIPLDSGGPAVTLEAVDYLADLGRVNDDGDHRHAGSALRATLKTDRPIDF